MQTTVRGVNKVDKSGYGKSARELKTDKIL